MIKTIQMSPQMRDMSRDRQNEAAGGASSWAAAETAYVDWTQQLDFTKSPRPGADEGQSCQHHHTKDTTALRRNKTLCPLRTLKWKPKFCHNKSTEWLLIWKHNFSGHNEAPGNKPQHLCLFLFHTYLLVSTRTLTSKCLFFPLTLAASLHCFFFFLPLLR